jgi:hypothetical protein
MQHAKQDSDRPGVAAASFEQASPTINWIASLARISGVSRVQVLPFADE